MYWGEVDSIKHSIQFVYEVGILCIVLCCILCGNLHLCVQYFKFL